MSAKSEFKRARKTELRAAADAFAPLTVSQVEALFTKMHARPREACDEDEAPEQASSREYHEDVWMPYALKRVARGVYSMLWRGYAPVGSDPGGKPAPPSCVILPDGAWLQLCVAHPNGGSTDDQFWMYAGSGVPRPGPARDDFMRRLAELKRLALACASQLGAHREANG